MEEVVQQVINALSLGSLYAVLALGLAMVFSVLGLLNFAYGELLTITGYVMWALLGAGTPFAVAAVLGILAATAAALLMELVAFRPLRGASFITLLFSSFAVAVIVQNVIRQAISPRPKGLSVPSFFDEVIRVGSIRISILSLITLAVGVTALILLATFLQRSRWGLAMRAAATDFEVARLMGARANRVVALAFAVSGVLAGIAGVLWVSRSGVVTPDLGFNPILTAFVAIVIGGLGSIRGAMLGGFALAALEIFMQAYLPSGARPFTSALVLVVVVAVLYVRPGGLVGRGAEALR
ncbi:MAG: branched-chain amino acid ABC transporter permease [Actinobacteria bacterium]|nr:branched-chain amino acid ABC transporter permease [Actinomycetota bacterium]